MEEEGRAFLPSLLEKVLEWLGDVTSASASALSPTLTQRLSLSSLQEPVNGRPGKQRGRSVFNVDAMAAKRVQYIPYLPYGYLQRCDVVILLDTCTNKVLYSAKGGTVARAGAYRNGPYPSVGRARGAPSPPVADSYMQVLYHRLMMMMMMKKRTCVGRAQKGPVTEDDMYRGIHAGMLGYSTNR